MDKNIKNTDALFALKKAGISKTSQRIAVLNILLQSTKPLSANAIRQSLKAKAAIDKVTVYRILSTFKKSGMIREIASTGGTTYFEMISVENPVHPHFNCRHCGEFTCMDAKNHVKIPDVIFTEKNYSIEHVEINVSGICSECLNNMKKGVLKRPLQG